MKIKIIEVKNGSRGFLPEGGFTDHANQGYILATISSDKEIERANPSIIQQVTLERATVFFCSLNTGFKASFFKEKRDWEKFKFLNNE